MSRFPILSDAFDELSTFFRKNFQIIFQILFQIGNFPSRHVSTVFVNVNQTFQMPITPYMHITCCNPRSIRMPRTIMFVRVFQTFQIPSICCSPRGMRIQRTTAFVRVFQAFQMPNKCRNIGRVPTVIGRVPTVFFAQHPKNKRSQ